jgi:crotonobetainyl-CoA:carnitine CoA-transferase CaiB-like acyl-CoA transferase
VLPANIIRNTPISHIGPIAHKPGYDIIVSAMYGMMDITGPEDGEPVRFLAAIPYRIFR